MTRAPLPSISYERVRLSDRIMRAAAFPVTFIIAPAGFGKTTSLHDFLAFSRVDVVRYDVRREDRTLVAFVRRFSDVIQPVVPSAATAFPALQQRIMESLNPARDTAEWFAEYLRNTACTIVVDDLHNAAGDPATIAFLVDVIDRTCDHVKWIIASRSDSGLPIASWVGYQRMDLPITENDLRFTNDEAMAAAQEAGGVEPSEVHALLECTEGWPIAFAIALRTRIHATDLRAASSGARELVYRYLAEQVFAALSEDQRDFLLATSVFSTFDLGIVTALGANAETVSELRSDAAFVTEPGPGQFRYHDLFRSFLENQLRRRGEGAWRAALSAGGAILEQTGNAADALRLYSDAGDTEGILRIVDAHGFELFERGHADVLSAALDVLGDSAGSAYATALGLRAMLDAACGRFDLACREFASAVESADGELRFALVHRYALELIRSDADSIELLEPYALDAAVPPALRAPLFATLATGYARAGRTGDALRTMDAALDAIEPAGDDARARIYHQAAFVYLLDSDATRARGYAGRAVDLALSRNLYDLAVRAYSVLFQIASDESDDPRPALAILDRLIECARRGANAQLRRYGLIALCWLEAERGNDAALEQIDRELDVVSGGLSLVTAEALLPATALRAAWNREFARAHEILHGTAERMSDDERRAYRSAELAFYAFAAGLLEDGQRSLIDASHALARWARPTRRALAAQLLLALAELVRGHTMAAHRHLNRVERALTPPMPRLRALVGAARAIYRGVLGHAEAPMVSAALERLETEQFGGLARLLAVAPFPQHLDGGYGALTAAERQILQLLIAGASTKAIAEKTGRSPRTVDTHIRSICQKLHCTGRRAAVALASSAGWVLS